MVNRTSLLARSFHHNKHIVRVCRLPSISIVAVFSVASTASVGAITLVKWLIDLLLLSHVPNKGRHPTSEPVTVNQLFTKSKSSGKTSKIALLMIPCMPEQQKTAAFVSTLVVGQPLRCLHGICSFLSNSFPRVQCCSTFFGHCYS